MHGELDGIWTSDVFDVEIKGNIGTLVRFHQISIMDIPQFGDTVISNLIKISDKNQEFLGKRIFIQPETNKIDIDTATFTIQEKETERFILSIMKNVDTIIFKTNF